MSYYCLLKPLKTNNMKVRILVILLFMFILTSFTRDGKNTAVSIGYGIEIGGTYGEINSVLFVHESSWKPYSNIGKVKSGWLYTKDNSESHAVAFFKVQVNDDGTGVIYINGCANPAFTVWFKTKENVMLKEQFCWECSDGWSKKAWNFKW